MYRDYKERKKKLNQLRRRLRALRTQFHDITGKDLSELGEKLLEEPTGSNAHEEEEEEEEEEEDEEADLSPNSTIANSARTQNTKKE